MTNDGEPLPPTPEWAKLFTFNEANRRRYARLVAKAWADDQFNRDLEANAADVLRREGFEIPEDAEVAVIRAPLELPQPIRYLLVIPEKPNFLISDLSIEQQEALGDFISDRFDPPVEIPCCIPPYT